MGTRNLEVVVLNGEIRVAQYCQWDGFPDSQGLIALSFLRDKMNLENFKQKVAACSWITPKESKELWVSVGADADKDMVTWEVSEKFKEKYPWLHRDCGAAIFELIQESENGLKLQNNIEFAADSVFCEWAYVVDLDKGVFEVYQGFNKMPLTEEDRFFFLTEKAEKSFSGEQFYPVKMIKSFNLDDLPGNEDFVDNFKTEEDE